MNKTLNNIFEDLNGLMFDAWCISREETYKVRLTNSTFPRTTVVVSGDPSNNQLELLVECDNDVVDSTSLCIVDSATARPASTKKVLDAISDNWSLVAMAIFREGI